MYFEGRVRLDRKTKNLVKRLKPREIAVIDHGDLDRVTAEALIEIKPGAVINASSFSTGRYPNIGPLLLCSAGIYLINNVGDEIFKRVKEGERLVIREGKIFLRGEPIASGEVLTIPTIQRQIEKAKEGLSTELEKFVTNTLYYMQKEKALLLEGVNLPITSVDFNGRHALVVVRGYDYKADLKALSSYIREIKPVLIGVDGGADALIDEGYKPNIIIGDMDSVSDEALLSGAELIVHAYPDGRAPGLSRLKNLGLSPIIFKASGTSEDVALLLAFEKGVELIVAVGTHANLIEFLDKGREGMASTFLVRLKVGGRLVDAKGVNKLYRSRVKFSYLLLIFLAAFVTVIAIVTASPLIRQLLTLLAYKLRLIFGI